MTDQDCSHVFCYGSLRPDDDSNMPWTQEAVSGVRAQPATVPGAKLYEDTYASLVLGTCSSGDAKEDTTNRVSGWVLTADPELIQRKLKHFDSIEGYVPDGSGLYQRAIADAFLGDPKRTLGGEPIGEEGSVVRAYVYHRPDCNKSKQIPSGDWLQRDR